MGILYNRLMIVLNEAEPDSADYHIALVMLQSLLALSSISIGHMAELCNVSKSTISKFVVRLGYESYKDFRDAAVFEENKYDNDSNYVSNVMDRLDREPLADYTENVCSDLMLPEHADDELVAVVDGTQVPLSSVSNQTFASGMLGGGVAFEPTGKTVVSPCNGTISAIFPTGHAFGVTRPDGVEVLVHIGINTVEMNGKGFEVAKDATMGAEVKAGQPIVTVDFDAVRAAGYDPVTMLIVTETAGKEMNFLPDGERKAGETVEK